MAARTPKNEGANEAAPATDDAGQPTLFEPTDGPAEGRDATLGVKPTESVPYFAEPWVDGAYNADGSYEKVDPAPSAEDKGISSDEQGATPSTTPDPDKA